MKPQKSQGTFLLTIRHPSEEIGMDSAVKAVVVTGAHGAFCAGIRGHAH